jgi:hypothetical protein
MAAEISSILFAFPIFEVPYSEAELRGARDFVLH